MSALHLQNNSSVKYAFLRIVRNGLRLYSSGAFKKQMSLSRHPHCTEDDISLDDVMVITYFYVFVFLFCLKIFFI